MQVNIKKCNGNKELVSFKIRSIVVCEKSVGNLSAFSSFPLTFFMPWCVILSVLRGLSSIAKAYFVVNEWTDRQSSADDTIHDDTKNLSYIYSHRRANDVMDRRPLRTDWMQSCLKITRSW